MVHSAHTHTHTLPLLHSISFKYTYKNMCIAYTHMYSLSNAKATCVYNFLRGEKKQWKRDNEHHYMNFFLEWASKSYAFKINHKPCNKFSILFFSRSLIFIARFYFELDSFTDDSFISICIVYSKMLNIVQRTHPVSE